MPAQHSPSRAPASDRIQVLEVVGNGIVGGMETYVERLIERLPRDHFEVTALCSYEGMLAERLRSLDIEVFVTPMAEDPLWSSIQMTMALVKSRDIDLLHAHLPNAHLLAAVAGCLAGKPILTTIHARQLSVLDLEVHRAVGSHLSVVCHHSYFHALGVGVDARLLSCEPNGVETEVFRPRERDFAVRRELGIPEDAPLIGFVGRLSPEKGPEVFVRAALLLRSQRPDAHGVIVGVGPMLRHLHELITQCGLGAHVHFAGVRADMTAVYSELDLAVSTSYSEAMPLAVMEAMASGLPVVATRVGGVPELVEDGRTGWLVASGDSADVAARCACLLADSELRLRMGLAARARAVRCMAMADSIQRVATLLARLGRSTGAAGACLSSAASALPVPESFDMRSSDGPLHIQRGPAGGRASKHDQS